MPSHTRTTWSDLGPPRNNSKQVRYDFKNLKIVLQEGLYCHKNSLTEM